MRFLAIGHHTAVYTATAAGALMDAEISTARTLYQERTLHEAYMDDTYTSAILLIDAKDLASASEQLQQYPMVQAGLIEFQITSLVGLPALNDKTQPEGTPTWWPDKAH